MKKWSMMICAWLLMMTSYGQVGLQKNLPLRIHLSEDGQQYLRFTFLNQVWVRYTDANPGSLVNGYAQSGIFDIGLRRTRFQFFGKINPKVYFYTQFGMNNFGYNSRQFSGAFFHDAIAEYAVHDRWLNLGAGLTGWSGLSRYASPSVGTILSLDTPLYQQPTNGINDQFLRKLSVYAKGKVGRLDYRFALSRPLAVQNAVATVNTLSTVSDFSLMPARLQSQAYVMYQFLDEEDNTNPYLPGTYLGKKRLLNLGTGFIYQPDAMWHLNNAGDTVTSQMLLLGADVFFEIPLNTTIGNTVTVYSAYNWFDFGDNYVRNLGPMNPANGVNGSGTFNGAGNAFPMIGTGQIAYLQLGYLFKKEWVGKGTFQLYGASQYSQFERLNDPCIMWEGGLNWLIDGGHGSKLSLNYQSRPVFITQPDGSVTREQRKGMLVLQYQVSV